MIDHHSEELVSMIAEGEPLPRIIATLRDFRAMGVTSEEVQHVLEALRRSTHDEEIEDRILEVLDVVTGFCSEENTVWRTS